jgi:hypothetical protein
MPTIIQTLLLDGLFPPSVPADVSVFTEEALGVTAGVVAAGVNVTTGLVTSGVAVVAVTVALAGGVVVIAGVVFAGA